MKREVFAIVCGAAVLVAGESRSQAASNDDLTERLEGTWRVTVSVRDCDSGAAMPPFESLLTFARGGTLTGSTSSRAFLPGQRSPDQGIWTAAGVRVFRAVEEAFILFDSPSQSNRPALHRGTQRISQTIEPKNGDEFTRSASTSYFDEHGKLLNKGCASATARRLK